MVISREALRKQLIQTLTQIEKSIQEVERQAKRLGTEPHIIRDANGNWALVPLLGAKAQVLHALTLLNDKEKQSVP